MIASSEDGTDNIKGVLHESKCIFISEMSHLGSPFLLLFVLLTCHYELATGNQETQLQIQFHAFLLNNASAPSLLQEVSLRCGWANRNGSNTTHDLPVGSLNVGGEIGRIDSAHDQNSDDHGFLQSSHEFVDGEFYIKSRRLGTVLLNYTSKEHADGSIAVKFSIPKGEEFVGEFTCGYNNLSNSTASSSQWNITQDLVFVYVPMEAHNVSSDSSYDLVLAFVAVLFLFLGALILLLIAIGCACKNWRQRRHLQDQIAREDKLHECGSTLNAFQVSANTEVFSRPGKQKSSLHSTAQQCHYSDEFLSGKELMSILSHPSPCPTTGCSCTHYKRKLLYNLRFGNNSARSVSDLLSLSQDLERQICQNLQMKKPVLSSALCSPSPPIISHLLPAVAEVEKVQASSMMATDCISVDSKYCPTSLPPADPKLHYARESKHKKLEPRRSMNDDVLSCDSIEGIAYPKFKLPGTEVSPTEYDLKARFIDPIETVMFDSNGGRYSNENHEVYLRVPRGAIPEGDILLIKVGISFHSALVPLLPAESRPVSPLINLCVVGKQRDYRFLKPVEVTLPHCVDISDEEDVERMGMEFSKCGHGHYCFHKSDGVATFRPRAGTATLKTTHFCTFCITANKSIGEEKIWYRLVKVVPKRRDRESMMWRANFCVLYYLRTCLQVHRVLGVILYRMCNALYGGHLLLCRH